MILAETVRGVAGQIAVEQYNFDRFSRGQPRDWCLYLDGAHYRYIIFVVEPGRQHVGEGAFLIRDKDIDHHGCAPFPQQAGLRPFGWRESLHRYRPTLIFFAFDTIA